MAVEPDYIMRMFIENLLNVCSNLDKVIDCWTAYKLQSCANTDEVATWFMNSIFKSKVSISIYDDEIMIFACADLRISKKVLDADGMVLYDHIVTNPKDFFEDIGYSKTDKVRSMLTTCRFNTEIDQIIRPEIICGRFLASVLSQSRGHYLHLVNMECLQLAQTLHNSVLKFHVANPHLDYECIKIMTDVLFFGFQTILRGDWERDKEILPPNTVNM